MPCQGNFFDKRDKTWDQRFKRAAKAAQFSIKANAEASFAVGEAKVETIMYIPHAAGWHLDTTVIDQPLDFGYFRLRGDLTLYALAGASVALEADASLMLTGDKQGLRGTPKKQSGAKAKAGAKGEAKVFAGLKEGVSLAGALQWLNPEGFINPGAPKKADINKAIAAYVDMAEVSADVSLIQGLAASLGFECGYRKGSFVVAAKAGACLGLGGSGSVATKVGIEQIGQFCMCIAHQLKQADYKKIKNLMDESTFKILNKIFYLVVVANRTVESFVGSEAEVINTLYNKSIKSITQIGEQAIRELEKNFKSGWGWYAYMPPESRGAVIASIIDAVQQPNNVANSELRTLAAFSINELMSSTQSTGHLYNTLDRITVAMGEESGRNRGVQLINSIVGGTIFDDCINRCETQLAKATPLMGRPFMRNDEPNFLVAQLSLHHPGYTAT
jgi:acid phosphatase family membrane protein YuiD